MLNRWTKLDWTVFGAIAAPVLGCLAMLALAAIQWQVSASQVARTANDIYHDPDVELVRAKQAKRASQHQFKPADLPGEIPFDTRWKTEPTSQEVTTTEPELHLQYQPAVDTFYGEYHHDDRWLGYVYGPSQVKAALKQYIAKLDALPSRRSTGKQDSILEHPLVRLDPELLVMELMDRGDIQQAIELATADPALLGYSTQIPFNLIRQMLTLNKWTKEDLDTLESKLRDPNFSKTAIVTALALDRTDYESLKHYGKPRSYYGSHRFIELLPTAPSVQLTTLQQLQGILDQAQDEQDSEHQLALLRRLDVILGLNHHQFSGAGDRLGNYQSELDDLLLMIAMRRIQLRSGKFPTTGSQLSASGPSFLYDRNSRQTFSAIRTQMPLAANRDRVGAPKSPTVWLSGVDFKGRFLVDRVVDAPDSETTDSER
jgi:hypothetical protein